MAEQAHRAAKPLLGVAYLVFLAGLVWLCIASYQQALPWQRTDAVTVVTRQAGLQLNPRSDVKLKGVVVGEVRSITSDGRFATLHLALDRSKTGLIPADSDVSIVPKTLFGEKQVMLLASPGPVTHPIAEGAVIRQSVKSVEIGELYTKLEGVLQTLQPAQLSLALNSLADALTGRGAQLGDTVAALDTYLAGFNPHLPTLVHDISALSATSRVYADAAPDLLRTLGNASDLSTRLLVPRDQQLARALDQGVDASDRLSGLIEDVGPTVTDLTGRARPVLGLLAHYSPELPCVLNTLVTHNRALNHVLGGRSPGLVASIDRFVQLPPYRTPDDLPTHRGSSSSNGALPVGIPSWEPHCPATASQLRGISDVGPYQLSTQGPVAPSTPEQQPDGHSPAGPPSDTSRLLLPPGMAKGTVSGR